MFRGSSGRATRPWRLLKVLAHIIKYHPVRTMSPGPTTCIYSPRPHSIRCGAPCFLHSFKFTFATLSFSLSYLLTYLSTQLATSLGNVDEETPRCF